VFNLLQIRAQSCRHLLRPRICKLGHLPRGGRESARIRVGDLPRVPLCHIQAEDGMLLDEQEKARIRIRHGMLPAQHHRHGVHADGLLAAVHF
jgi:hypothetical protein